MPEQTQTQSKVRELKTQEDLGNLVVGDVVKIDADFKGELVQKMAAVVEHPEVCCVIPGKLSLAHRFAMDGIYHISLPLEDIRVVNGGVQFDYSRGECIRIWGSDVFYYDRLINQLHSAGLE